MNLLQVLLAASSNSGAVDAALTTPTLITPTVKQNTTQSSLTTASFSPATDDMLIIIHRMSHGSDRSFNTPTTSLSNANAPVAIPNFTMTINDGTRFLRTQAWYMTFSGAPGSGTVTCAASNTMWSSAVTVVRTSGFNVSDPIRQAKAVSAATGTSINITMDNNCLTDSLVIAAFQQHLTQSGSTPPTSFTELEDDSISTTVEWSTSYRLTGETGNSFTVTDLNSNMHMLSVIEVKN